jgi:hypothetical protein
LGSLVDIFGTRVVHIPGKGFVEVEKCEREGWCRPGRPEPKPFEWLFASKGKIISPPGWDCEYIGQQPCGPLPGWHIEISDVYGNTISIPDIAKPPPRVGAETAVIMDRASARSRRCAVEGVPNAASREFERCLLRPPNAFERWQTSCRLVLQADLEARRYDRRRSAYRGGKLLRNVS